MSDEVIVALISGLCTAVPTLVALLIQSKKTDLKLDDNEKSNVAMKNSMIILLRSQIVSKCEKYQELGYLPDYARSCICDLFSQYKMLGGNHGVEVLVDEILKLPTKRKGG